MRGRKLGLFVGSVVAVAAASIATLVAATVTSNGITLTYPDYPVSGPALLSCEPWEESTAKNITLTGVPPGYTVVVQFVWSPAFSGTPVYTMPLTYTATNVPLVVPVSYPPDSSTWPVYDTTTNERSIAIAVAVRVTTPAGLLYAKLSSKKWWIRCLPPPNPPFTGCTPGYWKNDQHFGSWVASGYATTDNYETVFGVDVPFDPHSLLDGLHQSGDGNGPGALARHSVAALLNASNPALNYEFSVAQIIAGVQNAYATGNYEAFKDELDEANNAGCPLDRDELP